MIGYYTKSQIADACRGVSGLTEVVKRNNRWEHCYPSGEHAEITPIEPDDFEYENVSFDECIPGFEYSNTAGGSMKIIKIEDAIDYPMPKRWGAKQWGEH